MSEIDNNLPVEEDDGDEIITDIVTVVDDDGNEHTFEELDRIETEDGNYYVALVENFDDKLGKPDILDSPAELLFLRVKEEEAEDGEIECYLEEIDNDDEYEKVAKIFTERLGDYYDIVDDYMGD